MTNQNGQMVLKVLEQYKTPATFTQINNKLAQLLQHNPRDIRDEVKNVLALGVKSGYIQCQRNKYFIVPLDMSRLMKPTDADGSKSQPPSVQLDEAEASAPSESKEETSTEAETEAKQETQPESEPTAKGEPLPEQPHSQPESGAQFEPPQQPKHQPESATQIANQQNTSMPEVSRGRSRSSRSASDDRNGSPSSEERAGRKRKASVSPKRGVKRGRSKRRSPAKDHLESASESCKEPSFYGQSSSHSHLP